MRLSQERKLYAIGAIIAYFAYMVSIFFIAAEIFNHGDILFIVGYLIAAFAWFYLGNKLKKNFDSIKVTTIHHPLIKKRKGDKK